MESSPSATCKQIKCIAIGSIPSDDIVGTDHTADHFLEKNLHLLSFSLLLPLVPRGTLVRGYPVHSNVETWRHPPSLSPSEGVFAFDAGAIQRNVVAHNESVCIWTKGDEMGRQGFAYQPRGYPSVPCVGRRGYGDDGVWMTLWFLRQKQA